MAELAELMKRAIINTVSASKPTELFVGTVVKEVPLTIKIDDRVQLSKGNLILMKGLDLENGDRVLLIRSMGGQKYYVIGEVE